MKVGFIGLGRMGKGMALRLLNGGHDLAVYDVFTPATEDFRSTSARIAGSVADLCRDREVVITMLAEDSAVQAVALGLGRNDEILAFRCNPYGVRNLWHRHHQGAGGGSCGSRSKR